MKKFVAVLTLMIASVAWSQGNPPPVAAYELSAGAWNPLTSSYGAQGLQYNPPPVALYCYNSSIGQWVPATSACFGGGGGSGTVTTVSVATANGISGTVANPTTTPAITLTLGAITPTSVAIGAGSAITSSGPGGALASGAFAAAYTLPTATSSTLGGVKPDGTTITNSSGAISVTYGTASNTAAQGNDSRITGAAQCTAGTATGDCEVNQMTTLGDTEYGGASGALTRLAGPTGAASTLYIYTDTTNGSSLAQIPAWVTYLPIGAVGSSGLSGSGPISISAAGAIGCSSCNTSSAVATPPFDKSATGLSNPTADATFTYPNTSTSGLTLAGTAPASVSTATGTNATTLFNVNGVTGGASSNSSGTGGVGSSPSITAGNGGAGTGTAGNGGAGGNITLTPGAGGAKTGAGVAGAAGVVAVVGSETVSVGLSVGAGSAITSSGPGGALTAAAFTAVISNVTFTVSSSTTINANSCSPASSSSGTSVTMTGLASTNALVVTPNADITNTTGWGNPAAGVLYITVAPGSGAFTYHVCNNTASNITTNGAATFNVAAR